MNTIIDPRNNQSYNLFSNKGKQLLKQYVKNFYGGFPILYSRGKKKESKAVKPRHNKKNTQVTTRYMNDGHTFVIPRNDGHTFVYPQTNPVTTDETQIVKLYNDKMEGCKKECKKRCDPYQATGKDFNLLHNCYKSNIPSSIWWDKYNKSQRKLLPPKDYIWVD